MKPTFRFLPSLAAATDHQLLAPLRHQLFLKFPKHALIAELFQLQVVGYR
ncbi:hypothetical protein [Hymenobacter rubripertinctus]|nr:hypothetical protein [Hymenobacter rubripertinctus]